MRSLQHITFIQQDSVYWIFIGTIFSQGEFYNFIVRGIVKLNYLRSINHSVLVIHIL